MAETIKRGFCMVDILISDQRECFGVSISTEHIATEAKEYFSMIKAHHNHSMIEAHHDHQNVMQICKSC